jgi:hypothetical protein
MWRQRVLQSGGSAIKMTVARCHHLHLAPPHNPHHPGLGAHVCTSPNPALSGDDACVFEIIPGTLAKTTSPREVGRATGELCTAMGRIDLGGREAEAPVPPYYDGALHCGGLWRRRHGLGGESIATAQRGRSRGPGRCLEGPCRVTDVLLHAAQRTPTPP